ncbi:MAG: hypothetical protein HYS04_00925 [Acidobacteria bacterium]|nr:hypothetical protein [Acidobacteriota bacterium]
MTRPGISVAIWMLAVFLSGIVVGAFGYRLYTVNAVSARGRHTHGSPEEYRRKYVQELRTRLQLDDTQVQQLQGVLDDTRAKFEALRQKYDPEVRQIREYQTERIRALLTERQKPEYERFRQERERRMHESRK